MMSNDSSNNQNEWGDSKGLGAPIGGTSAANSDPNNAVDRNNNGMVFDGTPQETRAKRKNDKDKLKARKKYLEEQDANQGNPSQRAARASNAANRESQRGWKPSKDGSKLTPTAGRRGPAGPAGPRNNGGRMTTNGQNNLSNREIDDEETRWAPGSDRPNPARTGAKALSPTEIPLNPANAVPDVLPQERVSGDILRGRGPRRGNLEKLLRYWRPIMKREGGFRRCLAILVDHPELYPLEPLCAWLHHETTGLWPNEGCHHPGMKNCRNKVRRGLNGSLFSDSQFNDRLRGGKLGARVPGGNIPDVPGKSYHLGMSGPGDMHPEEWAAHQMDDDELNTSVIWVLKGFMSEEPEWIEHLRDQNNWEHVGDDDEGYVVPHTQMSPQKHECSCGGACGGSGGCGGDGGCDGGCGGACGGKSLFDAIGLDVKVGKPLSTRNVQRIRDAIDALSALLRDTGNDSLQMKLGEDANIAAKTDELFGMKSHMDPVFDYYSIQTEVTTEGILVKDYFALNDDALDAIDAALTGFDNISHS